MTGVAAIACIICPSAERAPPVSPVVPPAPSAAAACRPTLSLQSVNAERLKLQPWSSDAQCTN